MAASDFSYSALLAADAAGGLAGGIILESRGLLPPRPNSAFVLAAIWCMALLGIRLVEFVPAVDGGVVRCRLRGTRFQCDGANPGSDECAGRDPRRRDRRLLDVELGMRTFSGLSVGVLGAAVGIHHSLALSAGVLFALYATVYLVRLARR
jgi:hypothetical protein